ncbi:MAG: winged helix-turn-helix transcriptional regulator [Candidatus Liptonbacteria bacterium]|nr:winged helix-turn-helix transcriptional regulator [Candidatus Liptonbacteria bacterium]
MRELEKCLKALANRRRLAILKYLQKKKEASVAAISEEIELSFRSTSKHLQILASLDILEREQRSLQMFYYLAAKQKPAVRHTLSLL